MHINWYPGHMKKTREMIESKLGIIDVVYELLDARIPISSKNPIIDPIIERKPRITIFNKKDLADPNINHEWMEYYKEKEIETISLDSRDRRDVNRLIELTERMVKDHDKGTRRESFENRPIRVMIVGIPNVGKSTLINTLIGRRGAKVGNRPGITKLDQWIKTDYGLELLDTPGILWPKFEDKQVGLNLAYIGSIKDQILDIETLTLRLIESLSESYPKLLEERYDLEIGEMTGLEVMEAIGVRRGCIIRGGEVDWTRISNIVLDEFRKGVIGRISLERPGNLEE